MRPAALLVLVLAVSVAGCGGGRSTTTVIEKTVTIGSNTKSGGKSRDSGPAVEVTKGGTEVKVHEGTDESDGTGTSGERSQEPHRTVHLQAFRSPSGNIGCKMLEGGARCDIRRREWSAPPRPAGCAKQVDFGRGLSVDHGGHANFLCAGATALDTTAAVLSYGTASEVGGAECTSSDSGVSCVNQAGHGFFISTQSYEIF